LAAPGLVESMAKGQRIAADPAVRQLMLGLGADKGLHGAGLFMVTPSAVIAIKPIRHLEDFKGKKIRIFASQIQSEALRRLGAIAKPMTLGEVLPALHDNILDGAIAATTVFVTMHYQDAAKYVTEIGQPAIFGVAELSKKWYDGLPADLQGIVDQAAASVSVKINPWIVEFNAEARQHWISAGGELISLPVEEQSTMVSALASVGKDISAAKPELYAAYHVIIDAAQRNQ
jgi:TRAP-type transport system periplasmic protein